jgi:hypothetical protein
LGDEGMIALSTGIRMVTELYIGNLMDNPVNCRVGPKGLIAMASSLSQLKHLNISNNIL